MTKCKPNAPPLRAASAKDICIPLTVYGHDPKGKMGKVSCVGTEARMMIFFCNADHVGGCRGGCEQKEEKAGDAAGEQHETLEDVEPDHCFDATE